MQTEHKLSINISDFRNQRKVILLMMKGEPIEIHYRRTLIGYLVPEPNIQEHLEEMLNELTSKKRRSSRD